MLEIVVPERVYYVEETSEFLPVKAQTLQLEHSLVSVQKWESKWAKPFLSNNKMTNEEALDYIRCMTINSRGVDPLVYQGLTLDNMKAINDYITAPMTATTFSNRNESNGKVNRTVYTAEVIYWQMIALGIPFECRKWHLNQLLTLIRVCNIKNQPSKKMSKRDTAKYYADLNAQRKAKLGTRG